VGLGRGGACEGFGLSAGLGESCFLFLSDIFYSLERNSKMHENQITTTESLLGYRAAFEEMKYRLEEQHKGISAIKSFTQISLGSASVVLGLIGALRVQIVGFDPEISGKFHTILLIAVGLYFIQLITSLYILIPLKIFGPFTADWNHLYSGLVSRDNEIDILRQRLSNYLNVINKNQPIVDSRAVVAIIPPICLVIILFLLIVPILWVFK
jgi:hypothetical protein